MNRVLLADVCIRAVDSIKLIPCVCVCVHRFHNSASLAEAKNPPLRGSFSIVFGYVFDHGVYDRGTAS